MISLLADDKMASRVGASILRAAGLEQLVCNSHAAYEELAVQLAEDADKLFEMRRHLENTRSNSAAFDTKRFVQLLFMFCIPNSCLRTYVHSISECV